MIEAIGWLAGLLFAFCGLPQSIQSYRQGHSNGISNLFMGMWLSGEILMQVYVYMKHGMDYPLLVNYWINTLFCIIILKYKFFPRNYKI